jgi:hypothetical protein
MTVYIIFTFDLCNGEWEHVMDSVWSTKEKAVQHLNKSGYTVFNDAREVYELPNPGPWDDCGRYIREVCVDQLEKT